VYGLECSQALVLFDIMLCDCTVILDITFGSVQEAATTVKTSWHAKHGISLHSFYFIYFSASHLRLLEPAIHVHDCIHDKKKQQAKLLAVPRFNKLIIMLSFNSAGFPCKTSTFLREVAKLMESLIKQARW